MTAFCIFFFKECKLDSYTDVVFSRANLGGLDMHAAFFYTFGVNCSRTQFFFNSSVPGKVAHYVCNSKGLKTRHVPTNQLMTWCL